MDSAVKPLTRIGYQNILKVGKKFFEDERAVYIGVAEICTRKKIGHKAQGKKLNGLVAAH